MSLENERSNFAAARVKKAATLAVGTEVVDGQITDRNSAWISDKAVALGLQVIEHRAVADDREAISKALTELAAQVDVLFVTGGLGPTSDDFTRELISSVFKAPLEYDSGSWAHIVKRFESMGRVAKPIQKQQCYFPKTALVLENPAGTANAFWLTTADPSAAERFVDVIALPGPPAEIAVVWEKHIAAKLESFTPLEFREDLHIWRTLGVGESDVAERVEEAIKGSGFRVGYRAHLPYIEVKLWVPRSRAIESENVLPKIDDALAQWLVSKGKGELTDSLLLASHMGQDIRIRDEATGGLLQARLFERAKALKLEPSQAKGSLLIESELFKPAIHDAPLGTSVTAIGIEADEA
ncbi:MAG: competence/damage-inducible protein A, partial [Proteobacteria bacterium]